MKLPSLALMTAVASTARATYMCPASTSSVDAASIMYGYTVQRLLDNYYKSVPVNASFFSGLPNAQMKTSNGMTLAQNTATNVEGLAKQAELGVQALMELGMSVGIQPSTCDYTLPPAPNGTAHLMNAFYLEATLCGAFIGLSDYVQAPQAAFLTARLSAEHGVHAGAIRSSMQPVGFMPNSTSLTAAFTPDMVLQPGMEVGMLGTWLNGCATAPSAPCGGSVTVGDLVAALTSQVNATMTMNSTGMSGSGTIMPSSTSSAPVMQTGNVATSNKASAITASLVLAVAAFLT